MVTKSELLRRTLQQREEARRQARAPQVPTQRVPIPLTPQEKDRMEKEFYAERGEEQSEKLAEAIKSTEASIKLYKAQVERASSKGKSTEKAEQRLFRAEEKRDALIGLRGHASSGQYRYVDLISRAEGMAYAKLEKQTARTEFEAQLKEVEAQKLVAPTRKTITVTRKVEPLIAYKHIATGEMLYQSFRPEDIPKGYVPIAVDPTTLKPLPVREQIPTVDVSKLPTTEYKPPTYLGKQKVLKPLDVKAIFEPESWQLVSKELGKEEEKQMDYAKYVKETSYKELFERGETPSMLFKAVYGGGERLLHFTTRMIGREERLTEEQFTWGGKFLGQTGLFVAFSPLMRTGAITEKQAREAQRILSKTRFDSLTKKADKVSFATLKSQIRNANKEKLLSWTQRQVKLIKDSTLSASQKEYQMNLLRAMIVEGRTGESIITESGMINYDAYISALMKVEPSVTDAIPIMFAQAPTMRGVGITGAGITFLGRGDIGVEPEKVREISWVGTTPKVSEKELVRFRQPQWVGLAPAVTTIAKEKLKQVPLFKQVPKTISMFKQVPKYAQRYAQLQVPKYAQKYLQRQEYAQRFLQAQRYGLRFRKPVLPIPKRKTIKQTAEYKITKIPKGMYEVWIRRFGEWVLVGSHTDLHIATKRAIDVVRTTLAVSLKVTKKKAPVKLPLGEMFRPAKREKGVYIQKREFRLATRPEVKEIQMFKRKAQRNILGSKKKKRRRKINWFK